MGIVEPQTDLVVQLEETRCRIVKPARGSRLADRAAIYPAIVPAAAAIEGEDLVEAIDPEGPEVLVEAIEGEDLAEAQEAVETGVHLVEAPEGTTDQAHAPTAAEVPPALSFAES
jgi:stage III sporulation protein SpoIIIAA